MTGVACFSNGERYAMGLLLGRVSTTYSHTTDKTEERSMVDNTREQEVVGSVPTGLFIGGEWQPAENGATFAVDDPSTGAKLADVADATPADGMRALDAAEKAQAGWAAVSPRERSDILRRAYDLLMERQEELALVMTLE